MNRNASLPLSLTLSVVVGLVALVQPAPAHAFLASELTQIMNKVQLGLQKAELVKQLQELQNQFKMLEQQYNQLNPGQFQLDNVTGFRDTSSDFKERDINEGVQETCQKGKSSVAEEQHKVCIKHVQVSNMRFNAMVKILNDVKKRDEQIQELQKARKGLTGPEHKGELDANTNAIAALQSQMENDIQNAKYTLDAYATMLDALSDDMVALANRALTNKPGGKGWLGNVGGQVVQGVALKAGLAAASRREL